MNIDCDNLQRWTIFILSSITHLPMFSVAKEFGCRRILNEQTFKCMVQLYILVKALCTCIGTLMMDRFVSVEICFCLFKPPVPRPYTVLLDEAGPNITDHFNILKCARNFAFRYTHPHRLLWLFYIFTRCIDGKTGTRRPSLISVNGRCINLNWASPGRHASFTASILKFSTDSITLDRNFWGHFVRNL